MENSEVRCPKYNSNQITAGKKGFSLGKAAGGILLINSCYTSSC